MIINNDNGGNYDWNQVSGINSTAAANGAADTGWQTYAHGSTATAGAFATTTLWLYNYAGTSGWKQGTWAVARVDNAGSSRNNYSAAGAWRNTAAVTQFAVKSSSGAGVPKLKIGSRMTIFGLS
jgi:hypothetical protein